MISNHLIIPACQISKKFCSSGIYIRLNQLKVTRCQYSKFSFIKAGKFTKCKFSSQQSGKQNNISSWEAICRLSSLIKPIRWKLVGAVVLLFISSGITLAVPFGLGKIIDSTYIYSTSVETSVKNVKKMLLLLIFIFCCGSAANFGRIYLMQMIGQEVVQNLRKQLFGSILKQDIAFFDKQHTGELLSRLNTDTSLVAQTVTQNVSNGLRSITMAFVGVSMMFYMSVKLSVISLSLIPPLAVVGIFCGRYLKVMSQKVQSGLSGHVIALAVLYSGSMLVTKSEITVGQLAAFLAYTGYVGVSLGMLSSFYADIMRGLGASVHIWKLLDQKPVIAMDQGICPNKPLEGHIQFSQVVFTYPQRPELAVLSGLDLHIPACSTLAVVGPSGQGKSTVANLLLRFYDIDSGKLMLDGYNIKHLNPMWLRRNIGLVSQQPTLFSGSLRENILFGALCADEITEQKLFEVMKQANVLEFVQKFPKGLDTLVGAQGALLSGGQKQRIAIARAIIKNPKILIFDEATSSLDVHNEALVQQALQNLMKDRTIIIIAHRLSMIKYADNIVVLNNGRVIEQGPLVELLQIPNGHLRNMVERQAIETE